MGADDKTENKVDEISGRAKQEIGAVTGDRDLQHEGKAEQVGADLKQAGEKVKDAFR